MPAQIVYELPKVCQVLTGITVRLPEDFSKQVGADACDMAADEISSRLEAFVTLKAKERALAETSEANPHLS